MKKFVCVAPENSHVSRAILLYAAEQKKVVMRTRAVIKCHKKDFYDFFTPGNPEETGNHGGFALSHTGTAHAKLRNRSRTILSYQSGSFRSMTPPSRAMHFTGEPSTRRVIWAKSY